MIGPSAARPRGTAADAPPVARGARGTTSVALEVDWIRCDGYGMCAELLPEIIDLDDWGYPIVRPGALPADLVGLARRAVDICPVLALRLRQMPPRDLTRR